MTAITCSPLQWEMHQGIRLLIPPLKVVNQILERNARAYKYRRAAHDLRIGMNNAVEMFLVHDLNIPNRARSMKSSSIIDDPP